ncbi:MAG: hypothetical protein QM664_11930, partial [Flavihumibacter sp.]
MKKKICYLVYDEQLWSPLISRQVIELLQVIKSREPGTGINLLFVFPWIWYLRHRKKLKRIAASLRSSEIKLRCYPVFYPFPLPQPFPVKSSAGKWTIPEAFSGKAFWLLSAMVFPLLLAKRMQGYRLFHCRSYRAASLVLAAGKILSSIKLIFDPRSDYPDENRLHSGWTPTSRPYIFWKKKERLLLQKAACTICISDEHFTDLQREHGAFSYRVIPNNVNCDNFLFNAAARSKGRRGLSIGPDQVVLCYLGSMQAQYWHQPDIYVKAISHLIKVDPNMVFLFLLPPNSADLLVASLTEAGITPDRYRIVFPKYEEVGSWLSAADYGTLFLKHRKPVYGTKTIEYLSAGLRVIVNDNVKAAASLVTCNSGLGLIMNLALGE